jgi:hypothetical protein
VELGGAHKWPDHVPDCASVCVRERAICRFVPPFSANMACVGRRDNGRLGGAEWRVGSAPRLLVERPRRSGRAAENLLMAVPHVPPGAGPRDARGPPWPREALTRSLMQPLFERRRWDLPLGFASGRSAEPTNEGFAGQGGGDSDPCAPLAGFRIRVRWFWAAWRTQTLGRLLGAGNRQQCAISDCHHMRSPA